MAEVFRQVLVVDDAKDLRESLAFSLKRKGFKVYLAENGADAFLVVKNTKIDLVISDVRMPVLLVLNCLKKLEKFLKILQYFFSYRIF